MNWEDNGYEIKNFIDDNGKVRSRPQNTDYYFKESITWGLITSGGFSIRFRESGSIHDVSGMSAFSANHNKLIYLLSLMGTKVANYIFKILNPTINLQVGDFKNFPVLEPMKSDVDKIVEKGEELIGLSKWDWNTKETAWDFETDQLAIEKKLIEKSYNTVKDSTNLLFEKVKQDEENLNKYFIDLYAVKKELNEKVPDKDITVTRIFDSEDDIYDEIKGNQYILTKKDVIKNFISYAVGCMFGRYSLDEEGLIFAGGEWDEGQYKTYPASKTNIIPITEDSLFEDDITTRFISFVETVYGKETLEENLQFIADALGGSGTSKEIIRKYFLKDFFKDHCKMYQKRPIYWLFDSGKKNGFKGLMYLHRYDDNTVARLRTEYLHPLQEIYRNTIADIENSLNSAEGRQRANLNKELTQIQDKSKELDIYEKNVHHIADQKIGLDLDDGVKVNYAKLDDILAKIR